MIPETDEGNAFRVAFYRLENNCTCNDCLERMWPLWQAATTFALGMGNVFGPYPVGTLFQKKADGRVLAMAPDGKITIASPATKVYADGLDVRGCKPSARLENYSVDAIDKAIMDGHLKVTPPQKNGDAT